MMKGSGVTGVPGNPNHVAVGWWRCSGSARIEGDCGVHEGEDEGKRGARELESCAAEEPDSNVPVSHIASMSATSGRPDSAG